VGFIQKLPTTLIAAFRATLEEILEADLILHVVDISHPSVLSHIETVEDTLAEIEAAEIPRILVWNKLDKWQDQTYPILDDMDNYTDVVGISAHKQTGLDALIQSIATTLAAQLKSIKLLIPYERGDLVSFLFQSARVIEQNHIAEGILLDVEMPNVLYDRFTDYLYVGDTQ
jgi:GTP-binding protein HflX